MRHEISPSGAARHCVESMRAFFAETNTVKAEEIATLQLQALREQSDRKRRNCTSPT
jgi:hypothetical protein